MKPDVMVENHGTIVMVRPISKAAQEWVDENVPLENWQWMGGAFACEPRMVINLLEGMASDGLRITV